MKKKDRQKNKMQPVQYVWGLLCSLSSIDQERNNISLFNIIDQINLPSGEISSKKGIKKIPLPFEIITLWRRVLNTSIDDRELIVDLEIALMDPKHQKLQQIIVPLKFNQKARRTRLRIRVAELHITEPGDYVYNIGIKDSDGDIKIVHAIPFEVKI